MTRLSLGGCCGRATPFFISHTVPTMENLVRVALALLLVGRLADMPYSYFRAVLVWPLLNRRQ